MTAIDERTPSATPSLRPGADSEPVPAVRRHVGGTYLPGLDGLRAIAVTAVIAYHLGHLRGGFVGVDLFFVLSGWLITTLLLRDTPRSGRQLLRWWRRRLTRLTPAVAVVVLATLVVFSTTAGITLDGVATMTWWQNWLLIIQGTSYWSGAPSPLRHTWSLSIEEQFYLLWPAALVAITVLARRTGLARRSVIGLVAAALAVASFGWAAWNALRIDDLSRVYFGTDTRAGGLLLGCAVAAFGPVARRATATARTTWSAALGAVAIVCLCLTLEPSSQVTYLGGLAAASVASVALIRAAATPGPVARVLSRPALRWIGVRSYGLYLWSWPVQLFVEREWATAPRWLTSVLVVAATVGLAMLSFRYVEQPLRRPAGTWAARPTRRRTAWLGGGAALVAAGVLALVVAPPAANHAVDTAASLEVALSKPAAPAPTTTATSPPEGAAPTTSVDLGYPLLPPAGLRVMVMGDSQAFQAGYFMSPERMPARFASFDTRAILGCGVLTHWGWGFIDPVSGRTTRFPECDDGKASFELGIQGQPDVAIWMLGAWEYLGWERDGQRLAPMSEEMADELTSVIAERGAQLAAAGARLGLVQWVCPGPPPPASGEKPSETVRRTPEYVSFINSVIDRAAATVPGAFVVRSTPDVCDEPDGTGAPTPAKAAAMTDGIHVDEQGERWLWAWIASQIPSV